MRASRLRSLWNDGTDEEHRMQDCRLAEGLKEFQYRSMLAIFSKVLAGSFEIACISIIIAGQQSFLRFERGDLSIIPISAF